MNDLRFGILSTGAIARKMAHTLMKMQEIQLTAVGARTLASAKDFAKEFDIKNAYASYEELAKSPEVDAVYIATPHNFHFEHSILCLKNKKHVLCEKPLSVNAKQAAEMFRVAKENGVLLMEAMWTRFLPSFKMIKSVIKSGEIGNVNMVIANMGGSAPKENRRLFEPSLAGGALLDIGIYTITLADMILGLPDEVKSTATFGSEGTDLTNSLIFKYKTGEQALLCSSINTCMNNIAYIMGDKGMIEIGEFFKAQSFYVKKGGISSEYCTVFSISGYEYQVRHFIKCIEKERTQSPVMSRSKTLSIMKLMDGVRNSWGLKYPFE